MGISFSIPCDPCINKIYHWLDERVACLHDLKKNLTFLAAAMEELKAKRDDWSRKITREEERGFQRLDEVKVWLTRVETIEKEVNGLLTARDAELQKLCLCGFCSNSLKSSYRYGRRVILTLRKVEKLKSKVFDVMVEQAQISEVPEQQIKPIIVGQETMLDKAWTQLKDDGVGIMGLYGMGGVGKTTLLTQINNKFSEERCGFDFVIWVVVSKDLQLDNIQDEVARKVGLGGGEEWRQKRKSQKTEEMYNLLRKKRFVLLLDDIWEKVDLTKIGIPIPTSENQCKVAFTTRSQDVCARMGAENAMEVQCLSDNDAFDLFQKKVGKTTLGSDPEIPSLARIVARKCHGLPLALDVIGETMSCKRSKEEWLHAIDILTSYAIEFSGVEDKILPLLKFSYDSLEGEKVKECLLYCALLPEDYEIPKETLIDYWICEGIIDASDGIERAENKGYVIIGSLVRASLLMDRRGTKSVCMHDVVREMALWIASDLGEQKEAFVVRAGVGLSEMPKVKNWEVVKRMSLCENGIYLLHGSPKCQELKTFLLKSAGVRSIFGEFFEYMQKLVVLDLSYNKDLSELPNGISKLVSLQYLNLSWTRIRALRMDLLEALKNLNHLDLRETHELWSIAGISRLRSLKILKLSYSYFSWDRYTVEELETLEHLEILTIGFRPPFEHFLRSHKLMNCTRSIEFRDSRGLTDSRQPFEISLPVAMDKLRDFSIREGRVSEIKMEAVTVSSLGNPRSRPRFLNLSHVDITFCDCLRELTLLMFAPSLKSLHVSDSREIENIINKEKGSEGDGSGIVPFPKLVSLTLVNLQSLKNIYWNPLPFPYLQKIYVSECPNLKTLPLDSQSGKHGEDELIIRYKEQEWIDGVEWVDEATKTRFVSLCKKC